MLGQGQVKNAYVTMTNGEVYKLDRITDFSITYGAYEGISGVLGFGSMFRLSNPIEFCQTEMTDEDFMRLLELDNESEE